MTLNILFYNHTTGLSSHSVLSVPVYMGQFLRLLGWVACENYYDTAASVHLVPDLFLDQTKIALSFPIQ